MQCDKCNTEYEGKYCPACGTPAEPDVEDKEARARRIVREELAAELDRRAEERKKRRKSKRQEVEETPPDDFDIFS